jgi:hypothetical protein
MSQEAACDLLSMLVSKLNVKFTTDLGSIMAFDMACDSDTEPEKTTIIFVGGSHSGRLAATAGGNSVEVVNISMPGFRVSSYSEKRYRSAVEKLLLSISCLTTMSSLRPEKTDHALCL